MKLALLAGAWLAGILLGLRVEAGLLPVALLLLAALAAGVLLRLLGRSLWPVLLVVAPASRTAYQRSPAPSRWSMRRPKIQLPSASPTKRTVRTVLTACTVLPNTSRSFRSQRIW